MSVVFLYETQKPSQCDQLGTHKPAPATTPTPRFHTLARAALCVHYTALPYHMPLLNAGARSSQSCCCHAFFFAFFLHIKRKKSPAFAPCTRLPRSTHRNKSRVLYLPVSRALSSRSNAEARAEEACLVPLEQATDETPVVHGSR